MDSSSPCVSFIGIVDFSENARWVFLTESVSDLLGFEPHELVGKPSLDLVHPDEFPQVKRLHYDTISQDKAAVLAYLRMKHKDPYKGYVLCAISRTVAHNVLVGSVSFASMGPKAMHNASTAQEVTIITPSATNFEFRRWNDPSPMPPSPIQIPGSSESLSPDALLARTASRPLAGIDAPKESDKKDIDKKDIDKKNTDKKNTDKDKERDKGKDATTSQDPPSKSSSSSKSSPSSKPPPPIPGSEAVITFQPLPKQSVRTALILDRFSLSCPIIYCSNDSLLSTTTVMGRSFFDFVVRKDEDLVRSWIDAVKGWGVNERGQPSDGGFGFGKFTLCLQGRDSSEKSPELPPPSRRQERQAAHGALGPSPRHARDRGAPAPTRPRVRARASSQEQEMLVDSIFSAHSDGLMVILRHAT